MTEKAEQKKYKVLLDVLSAIAISYMLILPFWWHYDPNVLNHSPPGSPMPLQMKIFFVDGIPFVFGIIWLVYRHGSKLSRKYPIVLTMKFRLLFILSAPILVIIMQTLWAVK